MVIVIIMLYDDNDCHNDDKSNIKVISYLFPLIFTFKGAMAMAMASTLTQPLRSSQRQQVELLRHPAAVDVFVRDVLHQIRLDARKAQVGLAVRLAARLAAVRRCGGAAVRLGGSLFRSKCMVK